MKKKLALVALSAACIASHGVAIAGFVDMTVPGAGATDSSARVVIDDAYQSAQWDRAVPGHVGRIGLPEALAILLPGDLPGLRVDMDPSLEGVRVYWDAGLTRREALASTLPPGVSVRISGGGVHVTRAVDVGLPAQGSLAGGAPGSFSVRVADKTLRQTIARWAPSAGWSFENSYWAVDRDIPVVAAGAFPGPFKDAVLGLMATTEVTDSPAKPCFYTNNVVRIVPKAEKCDKTKQE